MNNRKTGSQSETPDLKIINNECHIDGYQKFSLDKNRINYSAISKYMFIESFLSKNRKDNLSTLLDIGCSNGLVSFIANMLEYEKITAVDHDAECIDLIKKVCAHLDIQNIKALEYKFGNPIEPHENVVMGALIHWIYLCTGLYGQFDPIFKYLRRITKDNLLIEWVDPTDSAILSFGHTSFNEQYKKEEYNETNFLNGLKKYFTKVEKVYDCSQTRRLYHCY